MLLRQPSHLLRCAFSAVAVLSLAATLAGFGVVLSTSSPTSAAAARCNQGETLRVLILLDTSGSLRNTDPGNLRIIGAQEAIDIISGIAKDKPGTRFLVGVDTFATKYQIEGDWVDAISVEELENLKAEVPFRARVRAGIDGKFTDYREVFKGAVERFSQPTGSGGTCDFLFWFTDGDHDTDNVAGTPSVTEEGEIDDLCGINGPVDELRQFGVDVTVLELSVNREPSQTLRRLVGEFSVGESSECRGLRGESIGEVIPATSASELERKLLDAIQRGVDPDFPPDPPTCENRRAGYCEYPFVLSEDLEWIKVYVQLEELANPDALAIRLRPPDGSGSIPLSFSEDWSEIAETGMQVRVSSPSYKIIWAHRLSEDWRGTKWGEDQIWVVEFFGPEGEKAAAAVKPEELPLTTAKVSDLEFDGSSLNGVVDGIENIEGDELLVARTRLPDLGDTGGDGLFSESVIVDSATGDFAIPDIVERIISATRDTDYLSSNWNDEGERVVPVEVSLEKRIDYGPYDAWPLEGSSEVTDDDDIVFCPIPNVGVSILPGGFRFEVEVKPCAHSRVLSDPRVTASDAQGNPLEVSVDPDWECQVPAGVRGSPNFPCPELEIESFPGYSEKADLCVEFRDQPGFPLPNFPASVADGGEDCAGGILVQGVPVPGILPKITAVSPSDARFDPTGAISVIARGGLNEGTLTLRDVSASEVGGEELIDDSPRWSCTVPARAENHDCPELSVSLGSPQKTEADLLLNIEVEAIDRAGELVQEDVQEEVESVEVLGYSPERFGVSVSDPFDSQGSLLFEIDHGVFNSAFNVEEIKVIPVEGEEFLVELSEEASDYECEVAARAKGFQCPELVLDILPKSDVMADLEVKTRWRVDAPDLGLSEELHVVVSPDVELKVWERGIFVGMLLALLGALLALALAARFTSARYRRRWPPIEFPRSHSLLVVRGGDGLVTTSDGRQVSVDPASCAFVPNLGVPSASAVVEGVSLKIGWGSLLAGGAPRIVASSSGNCRANKGIRKKGGRKVGVVGPSLSGGWVLEESEGRHRLVYWNVPDDPDEAQSQLEELATEIDPHLPGGPTYLPGGDEGPGGDGTDSGPHLPGGYPSPFSPFDGESSAPFDDEPSSPSDERPNTPLGRWGQRFRRRRRKSDEGPKPPPEGGVDEPSAPPGGQDDDFPWGDSDDPFGNQPTPA